MNPAQWSTSSIARTAVIGALGAIPVLVPTFGKALGLTSADLITQKADALIALGGALWLLGSLAWILIQRVRSDVQPLTLTKAGAQAHITPTSQVMQDAHDAINAGGQVTDMTIVKPPTAAPIASTSVTVTVPTAPIQKTEDDVQAFQAAYEKELKNDPPNQTS